MAKRLGLKDSRLTDNNFQDSRGEGFDWATEIVSWCPIPVSGVSEVRGIPIEEKAMKLRCDGCGGEEVAIHCRCSKYDEEFVLHFTEDGKPYTAPLDQTPLGVEADALFDDVDDWEIVDGICDDCQDYCFAKVISDNGAYFDVDCNNEDRIKNLVKRGRR